MIFHNRDIGSVEVPLMTFQPFLISWSFEYLSLMWIFPLVPGLNSLLQLHFLMVCLVGKWSALRRLMMMRRSCRMHDLKLAIMKIDRLAINCDDGDLIGMACNGVE